MCSPERLSRIAVKRGPINDAAMGITEKSLLLLFFRKEGLPS
jgi:hypothetical protein